MQALRSFCKYIKELDSYISDTGEVYVWGYGRACGNKTDDVLEPIKMSTHRNNVVAVAGGSTHSMALTGIQTEIYKQEIYLLMYFHTHVINVIHALLKLDLCELFA